MLTTYLSVCLQIKDVGDFENTLGAEHEGVRDIKRLVSLAEVYGYRDWLVFDATVVRGLSYYTGVVFEAVDRKVLVRV